jgi:hypothetical protein
VKGLPVTASLVVLAVVVVVLVVSVLIYNGLVRRRNQVDNAWSQIDVQLKRRYDLIPNLVEAVKGYAGHERGTLEAVTEARARAINAQGPADQASAENALTGALKSLFAVAESYPDLRASQNFLELQQELSATEDRAATPASTTTTPSSPTTTPLPRCRRASSRRSSSSGPASTSRPAGRSGGRSGSSSRGRGTRRVEPVLAQPAVAVLALPVVLVLPAVLAQPTVPPLPAILAQAAVLTHPAVLAQPVVLTHPVALPLAEDGALTIPNLVPLLWRRSRRSSSGTWGWPEWRSRPGCGASIRGRRPSTWARSRRQSSTW